MRPQRALPLFQVLQPCIEYLFAMAQFGRPQVARVVEALIHRIEAPLNAIGAVIAMLCFLVTQAPF
jgi:hypothetical protein